MPPNTPNTPSSTQGASQPLIRQFLNRSGEIVRQSVSSVMDIPTTASNTEIQDGAVGGEEVQMDTSENRKRTRQDSIMGEDIQHHPQSDSLIANSSLLQDSDEENTVRRRRISSDFATIPASNSSTPNIMESVQQQMSEIRTAAMDQRESILLANLQPTPDVYTNDRSSVAESHNLALMVHGIQAITNAAANVPSDANTLQWDDSDTGLPSNQMVDPRPLPAIPEFDTDIVDDNIGSLIGARSKNPPRAESPREPSPPPPFDAFRSEMLASRRSIVQEQLSSSCEAIVTRMTDAIRDYAADTENSNQATQVKIDDINSRLVILTDEVENDNREIFGELAEHTATIDRLDTNLQMIRNSRNPRIEDNQVVQNLLQRIEVLENRQAQQMLSEESLKRIERKMKAEEDSYYMRTLSLTGYNTNMVKASRRSSARDILKIIGSEDIMNAITDVSFSQDKSSMRITFPTIAEYNAIIHYLAQNINQIKNSGHDPIISFKMIVPPRFHKVRKDLNMLAREKKREGQIDRWVFVIIKDELCLKVSKKGKRDEILKLPPTLDISASEDEMETDNSPARCPICLIDFNDDAPISVYRCGHLFHSQCLRISLANSLKCPSCRSIPAEASMDRVQCNRCSNNIAREDTSSSLLLTRKCFHLHVDSCQRDYLASLTNEFPNTPEGLEALLADESVKGCYSCNGEEPIDTQLGVILAPTPYSPGMADYIPTQVFPPPQQHPESASNLVLPEPVPANSNSNSTPSQPNGARPRIPRSAPPLTGGNSIPVSNTNSGSRRNLRSRQVSTSPRSPGGSNDLRGILRHRQTSRERRRRAQDHTRTVYFQ